MLSLLLRGLRRTAAHTALALAVAVLVLGGPGVLSPQLVARASAQTTPVEGVAEEVTGDEAEEAAEDAAEDAVEAAEDELTDDEDEDDKGDDQLGAALGLTILSTASIVGGALFFGASADDRDLALSFEPTQADRANTLHERSDREKVLAISLVSLGAALAAGAVYMWVTRAGGADDEQFTWSPTFGLDGSVGIVGTF
jgi:hypothetical protein